jgi:hypothetical protein
MTQTKTPPTVVQLNLKNIDDDFCPKLIPIDEALADVNIDTYVENDGIGAYEFWGFRGYDKGTDYLVIEDYDKVQIEVTLEDDTFTPGNIKFVLEEILDQIDNTKRTLNKGANDRSDGLDLDVKAVFKPTIINEHKCVFNVEWDNT